MPFCRRRPHEHESQGKASSAHPRDDPRLLKAYAFGGPVFRRDSELICRPSCCESSDLACVGMSPGSAKRAARNTPTPPNRPPPAASGQATRRGKRATRREDQSNAPLVAAARASAISRSGVITEPSERGCRERWRGRGTETNQSSRASDREKLGSWALRGPLVFTDAEPSTRPRG